MVPSKPKSLHGALEGFHVGDSLEALRLLPDKSVDHVITDPPYDEHTHTKAQRPKGKNADGSYKGNYTEDFGFAHLTSEQMDAFAKEIVRISRGWALVFCADDSMKAWRTALENHGARWRRYCVWKKTNPMPKLNGDGPGQGTEVFVAVWCGEGNSRWNRGGRSNVWEYAKPSGKGIHKTGKPIPLMTDLVLSFTKPGELICDPFAGGGSTLIACKQTGRRYLGWERDPDMHAKAHPLVEGAKEQLRLLEDFYRDDTTMREGAFTNEARTKKTQSTTSQLGLEL